MKTHPNFFVASDGALCCANAVTWAQGIGRAIREDYARPHRHINNGRELRSTLRAGPFAWPGGYPCYFVTADGAALSFAAVLQNLREVISAIRRRDDICGWRVVACAVNWEDQDLICEHTGEPIQSAYGRED